MQTVHSKKSLHQIYIIVYDVYIRLQHIVQYINALLIPNCNLITLYVGNAIPTELLNECCIQTDPCQKYSVMSVINQSFK